MLFANRVALINNLDTHQIGAEFLVRAPRRNAHGDLRPVMTIFYGVINEIMDHFG